MNDIVEMKRQGLSLSAISAMTGFDRKTIRKYLSDPTTPRYGPRQPLCGRPAYPYVPEVMRRVGRDGYVAYASNCYPVPWNAAGQEVVVCEVGGELFFRRVRQRIAVHQLCRGRHQVVSDTAGYHQAMPFAPEQMLASDKIHIIVGAPEVQVRPLSAYDAACAGGM